MILTSFTCQKPETVDILLQLSFPAFTPCDWPPAKIITRREFSLNYVYFSPIYTKFKSRITIIEYSKKLLRNNLVFLIKTEVIPKR